MPAFPDKFHGFLFRQAQQMLHDQFGVTDALGEPTCA